MRHNDHFKESAPEPTGIQDWALAGPNTRTREAIIAGTSITRSPATTSCWDTR